MITLDEELENIKNDTTKIGTKPPRIQTLSDVKNSTYGTDSEVKQLISDVESDISNVLGSAVFERGVQNLKNLPEQLQIYGGQALMSLGGFVDSDKTVSMGKELIKSARGELQADEKKFWESSTPLSEKDMESFAYGLGLGIANYGSMLAIGYLNPVAGITLGSAVEIGQQAEEKIGYHIEETGDTELNKYTSQKAQKDTLYTTIYGVGSAIIEKKFGLGKQLKLVKMPITSKLKHVIETAVSEGGTETLQELYATGLDWQGGYIDSSKLPERFMDALKEGVIGAVLGGGLGVASAVNHRSQAKAILREQLKNTVPEKDLDNVVDGIYESANDSMSTVVAQELIQSESLRNKHGALYNQILQEITKQMDESGAYDKYSEVQKSQYATTTAKMFADQVLGEANKRGVVIDEVVKDSEIVYQDGRLYLQGASKKTKLKRLKEKILKSNVEKKPSLLQFIRSKGGVIDEGGELRMMDASKQFIGLVNKNGVELDRMGEALFEAGYFSERPTVAELLDYIDDELRGNKHYPMGYVLEKSVSQAENESLLDDAISEYADIMGYDISKMSFDEKQEIYSQMQRNLYASEDVIVEGEEVVEDFGFTDDEFFQVADETEELIAKIDEIKKAKESDKEIDKVKAQNEGRNVLEFNVETFKDEESLKYMKDRAIKKYKMTEKEFNSLVDYMKDVSETVMEMAKEKGHKRFKDWNERVITRYMKGKKLIPVVSAFKKNGDYPLNFDLSSLCTRREATNNVVKYLIELGYAQQLGSTQLEAIKDILKEADFTTACDICFVEAKRLRLLTIANTFAYEWQSVREALGITDDEMVGKPRKFTQEQQKILNEMTAKGKNGKAIRQQAYDKYIPDSRKRIKLNDKDIDSGITVDKMFMIAKLFKQDSSLAGVFNAEWLLSNQGVDWLLKTYVNTDIRSVLGGMFGTATPKPIEGFNIYDPLSWISIYDGNNKADKLSKVFAIGGFRGQSFSDFNSLQAFDYFQFFCDLAIRGLPIHMYTKVPALIKLFGNTGAMFNMSLVPDMVTGVDKEHAGLKPNGKGGWDYAWSNDSFPVEEAMKLREVYDNAGIIAVGVSDAQILKMLDDPRIDMIIPYHLSGISKHVRVKTGLNNAMYYDAYQNTIKPSNVKDFSYNEAMMKLKDPKKVADAYKSWCEENGYTPKFPQFKDHPNYYKLLEDFRGYNNKGEPIVQQAVTMDKIDAKTFAKTLDEVLTERESEIERQERLYEDKVIKRKIDKLLEKQRLDGFYRDAMMQRLETSLGKDNITSLRQATFLKQMRDDLTESQGSEGAKKMVEIFRKNDGVVYGYAKNGKIFLNENVFNANTPAHEFTHVWSSVAKKVNPKLWEDGKKLLKQSDVWEMVENDSLYYNIKDNEDAIASEVLARVVGQENEKLIKSVMNPNLKPLKEQNVVTQRIMEWFKKLWGSIRSIFDQYNGKDLTYEEFIHMPLKDLWDETRNIQFNKSLTGLTAESTPQLMSEYDQVTNLPKQEKKVKGSFDALTKSIKITSEADFSTYQHEFAHFWLDNIWNYANSGMASEKYIKEFESIKKWLGVKGNYPTRSQHEKFARAYEKYLYKGTNADAPIGQAFKDYENFIREVYDSIAEIDTRVGVKYRAVPKLVYDFFDSMTSGTLPFYGDIEEPEKEVKKEVKEVKEFVAEETKILEENRANYNLKPVQTDTKTGYLTAYEKMTGEKVEAGNIELKEQMEKAESFVANNPEQAERIVNGLEQAPEGIVKNAVYIAYNNLQKKLGNTDKRINSMLNQALELRRMGQEIASQRLAYTDEASALYWIRKVQESKVEALADASGLKVSELSEKINSSIKAGMKEGKSAKDIAKELRNELGVTELFQEEVYPTNETDVVSYNYIYKYVNEQLGLSMSMAEAETITRKADDMLASLENSMAKNGNPSVDFFVKQKDLENYANSLAPSSNARVLVSVIGRGNLLTSIKSPITNIISNFFVGAYRGAIRRINLGVANSIVSPELIKENKMYSWEVFRKTGYNVNNITPETPRNTILGEKLTHSGGEGNIRKLGRLYEEYIYKWSLGAGDVLFKDYAFTDYVALKATKLANGDVNKANELFKDASLIEPQTDEGKQIRQEAIDESLIATFQNKGAISEGALKARASIDFGVGFGEIIAPFVKTPANIVSMGLKAGFGGVRAIASEIKRDVKAGKILKPTQENIDLVVQNGLGLLLASMLINAIDDDDYMPPYAIATAKDKQLAKELNIPFNAVKIGNTWISLDYLGALASPIVGLLQARREEGFLNNIYGYSKSAGVQALSIPAFGNISDLFEKVQNLVRKSGDEVMSETGQDLLEQAYARVVPSIVSDVAKALDTYERETQGNEFITKIPVLRETAPKKVSVTSGVAEELGSPVYDLLFGSRVKEQVTNDVADELQRLNNAGWGVSLTTVTRSGLLSELDEDTKQKVREDFAVEYSKQVKRLIKGAKYKRSSDEDKQEMINKIRRDIISGLKRRYLKKKKQ